MKRTELAGPFATFLNAMDALVARAAPEAVTLDTAEHTLRALIANDDWLPAEYQQPDAKTYRALALYVDPQSRYSVVSFVWGPGQKTGIHNHTVWGLVGVLHGGETCEEFNRAASGAWTLSHAHALQCGEIDRVSPTIGDVHRVSNGFDDRATVSIHLYGGDIGRIHRNIFELDGSTKPFLSGYSNDAPWISA